MRRDEAVLAVDVLGVFGQPGVRVESLIEQGVWAIHFHYTHRVPIAFPLEPQSFWGVAHEFSSKAPKFSWLYDPMLLPHTGVDRSTLIVRLPLDCGNIAQVLGK